jgi:hypothetical protein
VAEEEKEGLTEVPTLEVRRAAAMPDVAAGVLDRASGAVKLTADFESASVPAKTEKLSETHFVLDFEGRDDHWFMFKLTGVAGKTVRVDLKNILLDKWFTLNPVYQYKEGAVAAVSLPLLGDDIDLKSVPLVAGHNGTGMPDTSGEAGGWHYMPAVWAENGWTLSFAQRFEKDEVVVAMRVPFTLADEAALMEEVKRDKAPAAMRAQVIEVGKTLGGMALHVVKFASGGEAGEKSHPCILMYAREHGDEQDSSWPVAGAIKRLLVNDEAARDLRRRYTFMFIPILDMDLAAKGQHERMADSFRPMGVSRESLAYGSYFQTWIRADKPVDIVLNMHAMISTESENQLVAGLLPSDDSPLAAPTRVLHDQVRAGVQAHGYRVMAFSWFRGQMPARLGGWLSARYGAIHVLYEVNMQEQHQHLGAANTAAMGPLLLRSATGYLESEPGREFGVLAEKNRTEFLKKLSKYGNGVTSGDIFALESRLEKLSEADALLDALSGGATVKK